MISLLLWLRLPVLVSWCSLKRYSRPRGAVSTEWRNSGHGRTRWDPRRRLCNTSYRNEAGFVHRLGRQWCSWGLDEATRRDGDKICYFYPQGDSITIVYSKGASVRRGWYGKSLHLYGYILSTGFLKLRLPCWRWLFRQTTRPHWRRYCWMILSNHSCGATPDVDVLFHGLLPKCCRSYYVLSTPVLQWLLRKCWCCSRYSC